MVEPHHVVDEPGQAWTGAHGLGWQVWNVDGARYAGHGGSMPGFLAGLRVRLSDADDALPGAAAGDGVVVMANTTHTTVLRGLSDDLLRTLAEAEPAPVAAWSAGGDADLLELVGTWHWGPSTSTATVRDEQLVLGEPGAGRGSRFERTGPDAWVGLDGYHAGEPLRVVRRPDGTVSHLDLASFRFTRTPVRPGSRRPGRGGSGRVDTGEVGIWLRGPRAAPGGCRRP